MDGKLFLVSTPIGNLEDITLRALNVLKSVDLVAAEDTRHTRQLLSHYDIHVKMESCHAFNEHGKVNSLIEFVRSGKSLALVSDAGTPSIADPGFLLVRTAIENGIEPVIIPGVSALTFAATASGLPVDKFAFWGFAPVKPGKRSKFFTKLLNDNRTGFFFESPFRINKTLKELAEMSAGCKISLIREATKLHEEVIRGTAEELANLNREWKGEFVIGIFPGDDNNDNENILETE